MKVQDIKIHINEDQLECIFFLFIIAVLITLFLKINIEDQIIRNTRDLFQ